MKEARSKFLWSCFCCAQKCLVWELGFKPGSCDVTRGNANKMARWSINWAKTHSQSLRQRTQETDIQTGRQRCSGVWAPADPAERQGRPDMRWEEANSESWTPVGMALVQQWEDATGLEERAVLHRQGGVTHRKQRAWKLMNLRLHRVENLDNEIKKW